VEREDPGLLRVFRQVTIEEPDSETGRKILKRHVESYKPSGLNLKEMRRLVRTGQQTAPAITDEGLDTLDRLHRRYAGYSAYPGRPVRFLRNLLKDHTIDQFELPPLGAHEITASFAKETGLPLFLLDESVAFDSRRALDWFGERVIGQANAVDLIVNLLAKVKAGLTRPRRPIASLLFAGPTGVGKTEMAKSLAGFFFGDEGRMARFDMSEYADALAVTRLGFSLEKG
jgi:ATP-dependent Clp protease ATP-binding subunit ClpA